MFSKHLFKFGFSWCLLTKCGLLHILRHFRTHDLLHGRHDLEA